MLISSFVKYIVLTLSLATLLACSSSDDSSSNNPDSLNQKPTAVISPVVEQFINVGDTINFIGDASFDPDPNATLDYEWTFAGTASPVQKSYDMNPGPLPFKQTGIVTVNLVVTDDLGLVSDMTSVIINIDALQVNRAPNGTISYKIGNGTQSTGNFTISSGTDVEFSASATDADNDPVTTFNWSFPSGVTALTTDRKSTRLNSSHVALSRMPSSA